MRTKRFEDSGFITDSLDPILYKVRLTLGDEGDTLTIYDSDIGVESGGEIAYLDADNPEVDFGVKGQRCFKGLYAFLPRGGSFYATWED